jgi:predicted DNA-binding transcriptional regulator AlpA
MNAMRKVRFAVLESSLLARKGTARPAEPSGSEPDQMITRADAEPHIELAADGYEGSLVTLITRLRPAMERVAEQTTGKVCAVELGEPAADVRATPGIAAAMEPEASCQSITEVIKDWTRRITKDRRLAANLHPRGLNRDQAAGYIGLSVTTFMRLIAVGAMPPALHFGRRRVWDRRTLDEALDRMSGLVAAVQPVVRDA